KIMQSSCTACPSTVTRKLLTKSSPPKPASSTTKPKTGSTRRRRFWCGALRMRGLRFESGSACLSAICGDMGQHQPYVLVGHLGIKLVEDRLLIGRAEAGCRGCNGAVS